jgi:YD repeat-containing protein
MTRASLLFVVLLCTTTHGQALLILPEPSDVQDLHFNPLFVQRNNIATIIGQRMVKRDGEPMRERNEKYLYRFNPSGLPVYSNNSFGRPGTGHDTASTTYTYDTAGRIRRRLRNDLNGHYAYDVELDDQGRAIRETYTRVENLGTDRYDLIPGKVTEISDEHFRYEAVNDSTSRKLFTNNHGLPFREQVFVKNKLGYLKSIEDRYLISNRRSRVTFRYDEKGRLTERVEQSDLDKANTTKRTWQYDQAGNVITGFLWHDERQIERDEYLYNDHTMELTARLTKDLASGVIHVVRFTTERR